MRRLLGVAVLLLLSACAVPAKLGSGEVAVQERLLVDATGWNRFDDPAPSGTEVWTVDGLPLDRLRFFVGIAEDEPLARAIGKRPARAFRAAMSPHEIVELYEAYTTEDASDFALERLAPATFVGAAGFRFEFALTRRMDSLPLRGLGYGAVVDGRLYLAIYSAPRQHYFEAHVAAAEAAVRSARLTCPRSAACASP